MPRPKKSNESKCRKKKQHGDEQSKKDKKVAEDAEKNVKANMPSCSCDDSAVDDSHHTHSHPQDNLHTTTGSLHKLQSNVEIKSTSLNKPP